jgi:hypothetical protein
MTFWTFAAFDLISDNVEHISCYEKFFTDMTISIFSLMAWNISDIDIPEPFLFPYQSCPLKDERRDIENG